DPPRCPGHRLTPSISFALIGVVVGEFLDGEPGGGLGYLSIHSLGTLSAADMMLALISLGVIGVVMAVGFRQLERRLLRWRQDHPGGRGGAGSGGRGASPPRAACLRCSPRACLAVGARGPPRCSPWSPVGSAPGCCGASPAGSPRATACSRPTTAR